MHPKTLNIAEYLFARLQQLGVESIHGVPGDYNLKLLDFVEPAGLLWVGSANELNAGYAADGYARVKGLGALITTFGVGELSAINAIACAYAERVPVVHIVGTPPRDTQNSRLMVHHTLGDGDYQHFSQMASHVTVAQTNLLNGMTATRQIDEILRQCLEHSRPVYIEIPVDMVTVPALANDLESQISISSVVPDSNMEEAVTTVLNRMYATKRPVILVDGETRALGIIEIVQSLVSTTRWPTFTTSFGKGLIDMTESNVYGSYCGSFADPKVRELFDTADLVLCFGPHFSSTNTYAWSAIPRPEVTIHFTQVGIQIEKSTMYQNSSRATVAHLLEKLDPNNIARIEHNPDLPRDRRISFDEVEKDDIVKQDKIWKLLANVVESGDIVMGETGTAGYGAREMPLPKHAKFFAPVTWLSIGYMLPACQGAALAQRELMRSNKYHGVSSAKTILLIGDGSFQMTAQELATIIRHKLNVVVFLINNDGYTIERCIHGKHQKYNDVSFWRYLKAPSLFGAPEDTFIGSAKTYGEVKDLCQNPRFSENKGLRMIEVIMERNDAPAGPLLDLMRKQD